jgi:Protein of unknown function (DUF2283)
MKSSNQQDNAELLALARKRVRLPDVPMELDYQDDVDTLCIRFTNAISPELFEESLEDGVIALYEDNEIVGVEILDISGQMDSKLAALSKELQDEQLVR